MTLNPFNNIPYGSLKSLHTQMIDSMLENDALTLPCTFSYGITNYEDCDNCVYDPIGQMSSNVYQDGGPVPFAFQSRCPMCDGEGKRGVEVTESVYLCVIFDQKDFIAVGSANFPANTIETMAKSEMTPKFLRAKELMVNGSPDIDGYFTHRYERIDEPSPCGLGTTEFVFCHWKRTG